MNIPVREGETIEGSRTTRNRPYPVLKCSKRERHPHVDKEKLASARAFPVTSRRARLLAPAAGHDGRLKQRSSSQHQCGIDTAWEMRHGGVDWANDKRIALRTPSH